MNINPFKPNSPSRPGMFVGRIAEIERIETALIQTRANQNVNFLLRGERGIGKTSLLNLVKYLAEGDIEIRGQKMNFLVIETDVSKDTNQFGLIRKIELALRRKLEQTEPARKFFTDIWGFIKKIEGAGFKINENRQEDAELIFEEFTYSLADTLNRITSLTDSNIFNCRYDGILIMIDESDNASKELELGTFLKLLLERLQKEGTEKLMFGLAGLPKIKDVLMASHPSSLRLFDDIEMDRLSMNEIGTVIEKVQESSIELNGYKLEVTDEAKTGLIYFSEGFPHFIHQYGYSAFELSDGKVITDSNVLDGAIGKNGALEKIGNKYYRDDYYKKIQGDEYRQVLNIMANSLDNWVSKKHIRENFKGTDNKLNNAIQALLTRGIILPKEGTRGIYRLLDKGFAWWIRLKCTQEEPQTKSKT